MSLKEKFAELSRKKEPQTKKDATINGASILLRKINSPYFCGSPLFIRRRKEPQLIKIINKLKLSDNNNSAKEIIEQLISQETIYDYDTYDDFFFKLEKLTDTNERISYQTFIFHKTSAKINCNRIYAYGP